MFFYVYGVYVVELNIAQEEEAPPRKEREHCSLLWYCHPGRHPASRALLQSVQPDMPACVIVHAACVCGAEFVA